MTVAERAALSPAQRAALVEVLEEARVEGLVGPGPVERHVEHGLAFGEVLGGGAPGAALDLGSGAGLPGLVLAVAHEGSSWVLLDGRQRSADFLRRAVGRLGLAERVRVVGERAEEAARSELRGQMAVVVARGVGPPAVTAEYAAGFLGPGGVLVVSEPPRLGEGRWPPEGLALLGMGPAASVRVAGGAHFARIRQVRLASERFPRRTGQPAKHRLF